MNRTVPDDFLLSHWSEMTKEPIDVQLAKFRQVSSYTRPEDVKMGFRAFAADLLAGNQISMSEYVSVFGGNALNCLSPDDTGIFREMTTGADASNLAAVYSRAKYGSAKDIKHLAWNIIDYLCAELDKPESRWARIFRSAKSCEDNVVMMTTGWRNVPSTSNVLYGIVVDEVNLKLAHMDLPTIINIKLPRIAPPCEHYANLNTKERERVNLVQDHVIPAENFYRWSGVHVIFGDDVLVTGSTADKVLYESMLNGAKTFQAIYPIAIDPHVSLTDAMIEERLNMALIQNRLDDALAALISEPSYQPVLRTLRVVFSEENREALPSFLPRVPTQKWLYLYKAALGNEFLSHAKYDPSLKILKEYLTDAGLLSSNGMAVQQ